MVNCNPKSNDPNCHNKLTYDGFFSPKPYIGSLEPITGLRVAGIFRGVAWTHGQKQAGMMAANAYCAMEEIQRALRKWPVGRQYLWAPRPTAPIWYGIPFATRSRRYSCGMETEHFHGLRVRDRTCLRKRQASRQCLSLWLRLPR